MQVRRPHSVLHVHQMSRREGNGDVCQEGIFGYQHAGRSQRENNWCGDISNRPHSQREHMLGPGLRRSSSDTRVVYMLQLDYFIQKCSGNVGYAFTPTDTKVQCRLHVRVVSFTRPLQLILQCSVGFLRRYKAFIASRLLCSRGLQTDLSGSNFRKYSCADYISTRYGKTSDNTRVARRNINCSTVSLAGIAIVMVCGIGFLRRKQLSSRAEI